MRKFFKVLFVASATILLAGYLVPERKEMPCCAPADYNHNTFWYWPTSTMASFANRIALDYFLTSSTLIYEQNKIQS